MSGNGYGDFLTSRDADMAAHDASPPLLRELGNYAVAKWSSETLLRDWRQAVMKHGFSWHSCGLQARFARGLAVEERRDTVQHYGPSHPEAVPE